MGFCGISAYACMHQDFPTKAFLRQFPEGMKNPCVSVLCGTFGRNRRTLDAFLSKFVGRRTLIQFHISNGPSRRSGRLGKGSFAAGLSVSEFNRVWEAGGNRKLLRQLDRFIDRILPFPASMVLVCPELEDNMTDLAWQQFAQAVRDRCSLKIVRNPCMGGRSLDGADFKEVHGLRPAAKKELANLDGVSINFGDGEKQYLEWCSPAEAGRWLQRCAGKAAFLWSANQQGLGTGKKPPPPHKEREFVVTEKAISGMRAILEGV